MAIQATCRNCNQKAPSDQFKLHYKYRMMVCPNCFSGRTEQKKQQEAKKKMEAPPKPPGWDAEDDYLEKMSRMRKEDNQAQFSKIPGTDHVRCTCASCKFAFKYNPFQRRPKTCPYCNADIPKLKTFNLL